MTVKSRLTMFAETQYGNVSKFEKACNLSNGYVNSMRNSVGGKALEKILEINPKLNKIWLLMGEGEMFYKEKRHTDAIKIVEKELPEILGDHEVRLIRLESFMEVAVPTMAELNIASEVKETVISEERVLNEITSLKVQMQEIAARHFVKLQGKLFSSLFLFAVF